MAINPIKIIRQRDYQSAVKNFLSKEEVQAYSMAILSFFALAFFSIFAIRPTLISFFNLQRQISDSLVIEEKLDAKINALLKAQEEYQKNQADITLVDEALPTDPQFPELVRKIESIINEEEATMSAFSTKEFSLLQQNKQQKQSPQNLTTIDFALGIASDYIKNESVLTRLLNLRRMITISFLNFELIDPEQQSDNQNSPGLESTLDAEAYYINSNKSTGQ